MKTRQMPTNQTISNHDAILEEFLPAIHEAAYSAQKEQNNNETPKDLLLAGLRGLKEVLFRFNDAKHHCESRKIFLQAIHYSIMDQIRIR